MAVWVAVAGVLLLEAKADAESGRDRLVALRDGDSPLRSLLDGGSSTLADAASDFSDAHGAVRSPVIAPLRALPVVGRQLRSFDALTGAAAQASRVGSEALVEVQSRMDAGTAAGGDRVGLVQAVSDAARRVSEVLVQIDLGPDEALVGPLADARNTIAAELADAEELATRAGTVAAGIAPMLEGPTRYLVLAANNAEMEAGSGMFLSAAELVVTHGVLSLGPVRSSSDFVLPPSGGVALDPDVATLWGFRFPDRDLRGVNVTPRFPVSAEQATRMWVAAGGNPVDGVLALDPVALAAILRATGPVVVQGKEFSAANVVDELLHQQYVDFGDDDRGARRDRQGEVAAATVAALDRGGWDVATLFDDLAEAAAGRHLMLWSGRPGEQRAWEVSGVHGAMTADSLLVAVLNGSGTKMDYFLDVEAELTTSSVADGTEAVLRVSVTNRVPEGEPRYVAGPFGEGSRPEGEYAGTLSVSLPGDATAAGVDGHPVVVSGRDGPSVVVASNFDLPRGERIERAVRFHLPPGRRGLWLEPAARVPALRWRLDGSTVPAESRRYVSW